MKLKENKKADKKETSLSEKTWNMVKDVATNEKKVNGQMIMIGPAKNVCSGIIND